MKRSEPIDVLNLEWSSALSRDRQMATFVCNYLRHQGLCVEEGPMWRGAHLLRSHRPRLYFSVSAIGDRLNFETMRYAATCGIPGATLVAEGNFSEVGTPDLFIWGGGNNPDQVLYERRQMMWTHRTRDIFVREHPQWADRLYVSGAVGFDVYRLSQQESKRAFLTRYDLKAFKNVVGYGCWDFGCLQPQDYRYDDVVTRFGLERVNWLQGEGRLTNEILLEVATRNPETLFLLKEHPGRQLGAMASAIEGLAELPNTLVIHRQEDIATCIAVCDFWLSFESTTAIESWLLGKQTGMINPSGTDFPRSNIYRGSPNFPDVEAVQAAIDSFYRSGHLPGFAERESARREIVEETIQWDDGLNHVRAGNEILEMLDSGPPTAHAFPPALSDRFLLREKLRWWGSCLPVHPKLRKYRNNSRAFRTEEVQAFAAKRMAEQTAFYERLGLDRSALRQIRGFSPSSASP